MASGLPAREALQYQRAHGYNEIAQHREPLSRKILARALSPISGMLFVAAVLSFSTGKLFDGCFILILLVLNVAIAVWQEHKADTAIAKLNDHLATSVRVLRDGEWQTLRSRLLVPRDVVELSSGGIVPADGTVLTANSASVNEAALTGESLPKEKKVGDPLFSGSFLASGLITAEITAVGSNTSFGKTLAKVDTTPKQSLLERDVLRISKFLSMLSLAAVAVLTVVLVGAHAPWLEVVRLDLSLVIAGIPISLPTVMTLIIAFGVIELAKKNVVVRRLSALEELANADLLLTDKTGTLTKNHIVVSEVVGYGAQEGEVRRLAAAVATQEPAGIMNAALLAGTERLAGDTLAYIPGDSSRKRSTLTLQTDAGPRTITVGAPQIVAALSKPAPEILKRFEADVERLAQGGYRAVAVASGAGAGEKRLELQGLIALSDEVREDAAQTLRFLADNGIDVVMLTGDNRAIAREISRALKIPGTKVVARGELAAQGWESVTAQTFKDTQAFAEILPEDKLELVMRAKRFYTVAVNGDGVNDLPAVKAASVGFAVKNAVDALRAAADIVLLSDGIGVMRDAFIEGRKIFARLYSYSLYRISESFRLILTIVILGLLTGTYPLSPLQLILLALLNDIPVISLAFDRVVVAQRPSRLRVGRQFAQSLLYGAVGIANSLLLYFFAVRYLHAPLPVVETLFFLKLTVSGHLLLYVAHTRERWWRYLPSAPVILATSATQAIATLLALTGFLMPAALPWPYAVLVWAWSFLFMQLSELVKVRRA